MQVSDERGPLPVRRLTSYSRVVREARAALEFWLLPLIVALLPYRAGLAFAALLARRLPLYAANTGFAAVQWRSIAQSQDDDEWRSSYRLQQLVDHADLFWSLTRSRRFILQRLVAPALSLPRDRPLVVVSFHFGQGLWLLHWLKSLGRPPRFVTLRIERDKLGSTLEYAYKCLRNWQVARLAGVAPIFTGGARHTIAETLQAGGTVYGLIDVPVEASARRANCTLFDRPACLPTGLIEAADETGAATLVLSGHVEVDGSRIVEARAGQSLTIEAVANELEQRVRRTPAAWHFWPLLPDFFA
jgi:hypothetical protein